MAALVKCIIKCHKIQGSIHGVGSLTRNVLCDALCLSRGTYYNRKRRERELTTYELNDEAIKPLLEKTFLDSKRRFGRKPIHYKLLEMGLEVAKPVYKAEHQKPLPRFYFKNLLCRHFDQPKPNLIWVGDTTYVKVDNQYYICVIVDLFSRRVLNCGHFFVHRCIRSTRTLP